MLDGLDPAPEHGLLALLEGLFAIELENDPAAAGRLGTHSTGEPTCMAGKWLPFFGPDVATCELIEAAAT